MQVTTAPPLQSFVSVATSVLRAFAENGLRKILITSVPEDSRLALGVPTLTGGAWPRAAHGSAELAQATATALASGEPDSVLIVQASPLRPDIDRLRGIPVRPGLWELIQEAYLCEFANERTAKFGLGDWLEILEAQRRSGDLLVHEEEHAILVRFVRGSIQAIDCPVPGRHGDAAEPEHVAPVRERIVHTLLASRPECRFTECTSLHLQDRDGPVSGLADLIGERLRNLLPHPYLADQIERHLIDTPLPNLKRITAGGGGSLTHALRLPLELLLRQLARRFHLVLIEAPTVTSTGLAAMLSGMADATLLVASVTGVDSASLVRALDDLRRGGSTKVAVLLKPSATPVPAPSPPRGGSQPRPDSDAGRGRGGGLAAQSAAPLKSRDDTPGRSRGQDAGPARPGDPPCALGAEDPAARGACE